MKEELMQQRKEEEAQRGREEALRIEREKEQKMALKLKGQQYAERAKKKRIEEKALKE